MLCDICNRNLNNLPEEGCEECGIDYDPLQPDFNQALNFDKDAYNPYDFVPDNLIEPMDEDL